MVGLSTGEKHFIRGGIQQDLRCDGRQRLHFHPISIETGVIAQENGSARVRLGGTDVIASIKGKGGEEFSLELSTPLQRCLLGGHIRAGPGINLSALILVEGKLCWDLYIDGLIVSADENQLDGLGAAIKAALSSAAIPKVNVLFDASTSDSDQPEVDILDEQYIQLVTSNVPVIITLTKVGMHYIVDATVEEESQMSYAVSIFVNRHGQICGLFKRGGMGFDPSVIFDMVSIAKHVSKSLTSVLDSNIAATAVSAANVIS